MTGHYCYWCIWPDTIDHNPIRVNRQFAGLRMDYFIGISAFYS
ncbi:hypothetical protein SAMN05216388_100932 [Halorientalis persicus]|uniref:Uncharacterized protein n=1 Tax=Halorientalis persicus TaxID=1367881 RepID=A0A1H8MKQ6_9EURY|nr:hypothetical protein SAMN05216388_100932 [Halorientalis persicus]